MRFKKRFKPKPPSRSTPLTMEQTTIILPRMEELEASIGALWDCRTSTSPNGQNIFKQTPLETGDYLETVPVTDMLYTMSRVRDANGKAELLDVSVEVKIEMPQFTVEGGVSFHKGDSKKSEQEEFYFQYNVQTGVQRIRASVLDPKNAEYIIDEKVQADVQDGKSATHFISEIRYGGWATGKFLLTDKMEHHILDLSGYVGGTVPVFAGISVGLKASLGFLDENKNESFSKEIEFKSSPAIPASYKSLEEMFAALESLPQAIDGTTGVLIKGIPISVKLSPLSTLINLEAGYEKYELLDEEVLESFEKMVFYLHDLKMNDYYKDKLRLKDPRLVAMFSQEGSLYESNPWASKVDSYQEFLEKQAIKMSDGAQTLFSAYKKGTSKAEDIRNFLNDFENSIIYWDKVDVVLRGDVAEGKKILNWMRPADAVIAGEPKLFVFNSDDWEELFNEFVGYKLLLSTNLKHDEKLPDSIFLKLYSLTPTLKNIGFLVQVGAPNITEDFSLTLQIEDKAQIKFLNDDIIKALEFLEVIAQSTERTGLMSNTAKFISILASIKMGGNEQWDWGGFGNYYHFMKGQLEDKRAISTNNYLQTVETLRSSEDAFDYVFFLPVQFLTSAYECVFYFDKFLNFLKGKEVSFRTVVGCLDTFGEGDGPLLLVLDRKGSVMSICTDPFDIYILQMHFILEGNFALDCLSPNLMGTFPLSPLNLELTLEICNILTGDELSMSLPSSPFMPPRDNMAVLEAFLECQEILRITAFSPLRDLVSFECKKTSELFDGRVMSILIKNGWVRDRGFEKDADWAIIMGELESLQHELCEDGITDMSKLILLVQILQFVGVGPEKFKSLKDVLQSYVDKLFKALNQEYSPLHLEILGIIAEIALLVSPKDLHIYVLKALKLVQSSKYNSNYYEMHTNLKSLWVSTSNMNDTVNKVLECLATYSKDEKKWVWNNPKFQYWVEFIMRSKSHVAKIYKLFCKGDVDTEIKGGGIPSWFSQKHKRILQTVYEFVEHPGVKWQRVWLGVEDMIETFAELLVKDNLPDDFTQVLKINLDNNSSIFDNLKSSGSLDSTWNDADGHFTSAWGLKEIFNAYNNLKGGGNLPKSIKLQNTAQIKCPSCASTSAIKSTSRKISKVSDEFQFNSQWLPYTEGTFDRISIHDFYNFKFDNEIPPFILLDTGELKTTAGKIVPYLLSKIRETGNASALSNLEVLTYIDYKEIEKNLLETGEHEPSRNIWELCFPQRNQSLKDSAKPNSNSVILTRSDYLTLLLSCVDDNTKSEVLRRISKKSSDLYALPWFIPDITVDELEPICLSEHLRLVDLDEFFSNPIVETLLLKPPFKLITAIRVGQFQNSHFGKSTILNSLLSSCRFSSRYDPGWENGPPISRKGLVELSWLSESTVCSDFDSILSPYYSEHEREIGLLANVHGDALTLPESLFKTLREYSGAFLIFWGCANWNEMVDLKQQIDQLLNDKEVYNIVLNPDKTIKRNVDERLIIEGDLEHENIQKFHSLMGDILEGCATTIKLENLVEDPIVEFVREKSVQSVRRSLKLQNPESESDKDLEEIRDEILNLFWQLLSTGEQGDLLGKLWKTNHKIMQLTSGQISESVEKMALITARLETKLKDYEDYIIQALRATRHNLNFQSLSLSNFIREFILQGDNPQFATLLQEIFYQGFPLEIINLRYFEPFHEYITNCFALDIKFATVSFIGPQGSHKSALINQLFSPGLEERHFGCTNGVVARLVHLNPKPKALHQLDAILVLDTEDFSRTDNSLDYNSALKERQITSLVFSMSDLCIMTEGQWETEADWETNLQGILGTTFLAYGSIQFPKFPDVIVATNEQILRTGQNRAIKFSEILKTVSNLTSQHMIQTRNNFSIIQKIQSLYTRVLSGDLEHKLPLKAATKAYGESLNHLRNKIILSFSSAEIRPGEEIMTKSTEIWKQTSEYKFSKTLDIASLQVEMDLNSLVISMKKCYEISYSSHEPLIKQPGNDLNFSGLNGLPHFCLIIEDNECKCEEQLAILKGLESSLAESVSSLRLKIVLNDLQNYALQLRADMVARLTQEDYAKEFIEQKNGKLAKILEEIISGGGDDWIQFKRYVANLLQVGPWPSIVEKEIEKEYGNKMLLELTHKEIEYEQLEAFDLESMGIWGLSPPDLNVRVEISGSRLTWEEYVWLEIEVDKEIRRGLSRSWQGYRRGLVGMLREGVNTILAVLKTSLPKEFEFLPSFVQDVHFLAVRSFVRYWEEEWEKWEVRGNPLRLLEERKDKFPDELFLVKENEVFRKERQGKRKSRIKRNKGNK